MAFPIIPAMIAGRSPVQISNRDLAGSASSTSSRTFSGLSFGPEAPGRVLAVTWTIGTGDSNRWVTSMTIGGVSATEIIPHFRHLNGNAQNGSMWAALVPSGTSGSVVVNTSSSTPSAILVSSVLNAKSLTPFDTNTDTGTSSMDLDLEIPSGGAVLAMGGAAGGSGGSFTFGGGLTEDLSGNPAASTIIDAAHRSMQLKHSGTLGIGVTFSGSEYLRLAMSASWEPA